MESMSIRRMPLRRLNGWRRAAKPSEGFTDCALIVPTFRRPKEVVRLLDALGSLPDIPCEVFVVDGSPDACVECAIRRWAETPGLRFDLIWIESPPGLTRQRNVGLDVCQRELIFFLDDDCLPEPGYFREIRQVFIADTERKVGAVRGFLTNGVNLPISPLWRLRRFLGLAPRSEPGRYHASGYSGSWNMVPRFSGVREVEVFAGGASAFRREVFSKHRFSEFFYGYASGEDLEFSRRMAKDWKLMICGDALVNHAHAESGRPAGFPRGRMTAKNRYFIWKRHSPGAGLKDRARFWGDQALIIIFHALVYLRRPQRIYPLAYAAGTFCGIVECLFLPPSYDEPPAKREYECRFE